MILSIKRSSRWPKFVVGAVVLIVVAYVFHAAGVQDAEPAVPKVIVTQMPVVAPPAELMNEPAPAPVARPMTPPVPVPAAPEAPAEQDVPTPTRAVTATLKKSYACTHARVGGAEEAIQRIVARDGTISAAQMEALRSFEARCLSETAEP